MLNNICFIRQSHGGYGDIFLCQAIVEKYVSAGYNVIWPLTDDLLWLKDYIKTPGLEFTPLVNLPKEFHQNSVIHRADFAFLPLDIADRYFPGESVLKSKFKLLDIDWRGWQDSFNFQRDYKKEQELFDKLGLRGGEEYSVISTIVGTPPHFRQQEVYSEPSKRVIQIDFIPGFNCLDWCKVLENCSQLAIVDSVWNYICEKLTLKADKLFLTSRFDPPDFSHIDGLFRQNWIRVGV